MLATCANDQRTRRVHDEKGEKNGPPYIVCQTDKKVAILDYRAYMVRELIPVLGSQPAVDVSHKPGGRMPLLSARSAVTLATLKRAATIFADW